MWVYSVAVLPAPQITAATYSAYGGEDAAQELVETLPVDHHPTTIKPREHTNPAPRHGSLIAEAPRAQSADEVSRRGVVAGGCE